MGEKMNWDDITTATSVEAATMMNATAAEAAIE